MFELILSVLLFLLPGFASEQYYLNLTGRTCTDNKLSSIVRALCFSAAVLLFRCVISISRGYSDLPVQELFLSIGNASKYLLLSAVMTVLMPNAFLLVERLFAKMK